MENHNYSFGKRLISALELRKMKQSELAEKLFSTNATISRYVNDKRKPDSDFVREIAIILNVTADYLLGLSDNPEPCEKRTTQKNCAHEKIKYENRDGILDDGRHVSYGIDETAPPLTSEELLKIRLLIDSVDYPAN